MATQPTQLPVPSEKPQDLKFNAGKIDEFVTSQQWTYTDRFGGRHYTIAGINYLAQQVMNAFGYITLSGVSFTTGATIDQPNEVLFNEDDNEFYKWTGSFSSGPKVVPANSTPESAGGIGPGKWLSVGDATLRGELGMQDGERLIGSCPDIETLRTIEPQNPNQKITVLGYYSGHVGIGGGTFIYSSSDATTPDNGVTVFVTAGGKRWVRANGPDLFLQAEWGGMLAGSTGDAAQNSDAFERLTACLPHTGGTIILNGFYNTKYGAIVPPRVTLMGAGMDSCGLVKTGNDIKAVPDRMWQGTPHSFSKDFIAAVDMDSDTTGNLDGNQTRSTRIIGLSLLCTAPNPSEFGIYSAISYDVRLEDLYIHNVKTGYRTSDSWLQVWSNITIKDVVNGIKVDAGGTTYNISNVYVRNVSGVAYDFHNITYISLTCCAADFVNGTAYKITDSTSIGLSGCGSESVTGKQWDFSGSRIHISAYRSVNPKDGGVETIQINTSTVTLVASFLPDYSGTKSSKYVYINDSNLNMDNSGMPDHSNSRVRWGLGQSWFNIYNFQGVTSVSGNSSWVLLGRTEAGIFTVMGALPPDTDTNFLSVGTRWELLTPSSAGPWKWIWLGDVWHVAGSIN